MAALLLGALSTPALSDSGGYDAQVRSGFSFHDGVVRTYLYYVPNDLPGSPVPLMFMLHGGGGTSEVAMNYEEGRWNQLADQYKFIMVYPQGLDHHWNDCRADFEENSGADDVGFIDALITRFSANYAIDERRIYAAGHSNGGMMCMRLALELSDRLAAVCSCAGPLAAASKCASPANPVSVMYVAGTADPLVPFDGGQVSIGGLGEHGSVESANETVNFWITFLGADPSPTVTRFPDTVPSDGSTVTSYRYGNSAAGTEVLFYRVDGGGHSWPSPTGSGNKNRDISTCDEAWAFFRNHTRAAGGPASPTPTTTQSTTAAVTNTSSRAPGPGVLAAFAACGLAAARLARRR